MSPAYIPKVYVIATAHPEYRDWNFHPGDVVIDPWRMVAPKEGVTLMSLGRHRPETISLLVPSRGRPDGLAAMMDTAIATAIYPRQLEFVVYLDEDDPKLDEYRRAGDERTLVIIGDRIVLSEMWNTCYAESTGQIVMHCGDDIRFLTDGWDQMVREEFDKTPDKILFVYGNDLGPNGEVFGTHGFVHRRWVETVGYFVPPYFSSDWNDVWLNEVANAIGRCRLLPFDTEHLHPYFGKGEYDLTHQEREDRGKRDKVVEQYEATKGERERDARVLRAAMS